MECLQPTHWLSWVAGHRGRGLKRYLHFASLILQGCQGHNFFKSLTQRVLPSCRYSSNSHFVLRPMAIVYHTWELQWRFSVGQGSVMIPVQIFVESFVDNVCRQCDLADWNCFNNIWIWWERSNNLMLSQIKYVSASTFCEPKLGTDGSWLLPTLVRCRDWFPWVFKLDGHDETI